jgi:hypothetical protein
VSPGWEGAWRGDPSTNISCDPDCADGDRAGRRVGR